MLKTLTTVGSFLAGQNAFFAATQGTSQMQRRVIGKLAAFFHEFRCRSFTLFAVLFDPPIRR